jgi:hypothetical protein
MTTSKKSAKKPGESPAAPVLPPMRAIVTADDLYDEVVRTMSAVAEVPLTALKEVSDRFKSLQSRASELLAGEPEGSTHHTRALQAGAMCKAGLKMIALRRRGRASHTRR